MKSIPGNLKQYSSWVCWKKERRGERMTKVPVCARSGKLAETNNPDTWSSYDEALSFFQNSSNSGCSGIGFVFSADDPFTGIDLDDCIDEHGNVADFALEIVKRFDSYTEVSPSGKGLHIIVEGKLPPGGRKKEHIEMYDEKRFFTFTGDPLNGVVKDIAPRQDELTAFHTEVFGKQRDSPQSRIPSAHHQDAPELLERSFSFKNGEKYKRLFQGDWTGYPSQSEAELAFCCHCAWLFDKNMHDIDACYRDSGLYRPKWDEKHSGDGRTYGEMTIQEACKRTKGAYRSRTEKTDYTKIEITDEIKANYPLPRVNGLSFQYGYDDGQIILDRLEKMSKDGQSGAPIPLFRPMSSLFGVPARLRYVDKADAYGLRINIQGFDGKLRTLDKERSQLATANAAEIKKELLAHGLRLYPESERTLVATLKAVNPSKEILVVTRPGLHHPNGFKHPFFVTPAGQVFGVSDLPVELSVNQRLPEPYTSGNFGAWQAAIKKAVTAPDCPHFTIGAVAGFAGPVLSLANLDTCGLNLSGFTSKGKSTAQKLGISAFSTINPGKGLFFTFRSTDNALESLAVKASGTLLALDDLALADGREVKNMLYMLSTGAGKSRMDHTASLMPNQSWNTFALLSGERSLEETISVDGGTFQAGLAVRVPDIDVTDVNERIDKQYMADIEQAYQNYGHAGPLFVKNLFEKGVHLRPDLLRKIITDRARLIADSDESQRLRSALPFAVLHTAGSLAVEYGIMPKETEIDACIQWSWDKFISSSDALSLDPNEQIVQNLRHWVAERWDVTIKDLTGTIRNNREAEAWYDENAVCIPSSRLVDAAGNIAKQAQIGKVLESKGLLHRRESEKQRTINYVPELGRGKFYALKRDEFGRQHNLDCDYQ